MGWEDILGGGKVVQSVLDALSRGVGAVYEPTHLRRMAKAKADADRTLRLEGARTDALVEAERNQIELQREPDKVLERAGARIRTIEMKRQDNLDQIAAEAIELAGAGDAGAAGDGANARPIDDDWILTFIDYAANISAGEVRGIWAKILAGQADERKPAISRATLDSLRLLEPRHAHLFDHAIRLHLALGQIMDISDPPDGANYNINLHDAMALEEMGFLKRVSLNESALNFNSGVFTFWETFPSGGFRGERDWVERLKARDNSLAELRKYLVKASENDPSVPLGRANIRVDRQLLTSRGYELASVLIDGFYDIAGGSREPAAADLHPFHDGDVQADIMAQWADGFADRPCLVIFNELLQTGTRTERRSMLDPVAIFDPDEGAWLRFEDSDKN